MPPYCERHQMFHNEWEECHAMRTRERLERVDKARREHAERIAREQIEAWGGDPIYPVLEIATAAALQALTEKENAR